MIRIFQAISAWLAKWTPAFIAGVAVATYFMPGAFAWVRGYTQTAVLGVISGAARVETGVIPTENATSPLQRKLMMLDDTPPGQQPTRISPTPTAFGNPITCMST